MWKSKECLERENIINEIMSHVEHKDKKEFIIKSSEVLPKKFRKAYLERVKRYFLREYTVEYAIGNALTDSLTEISDRMIIKGRR